MKLIIEKNDNGEYRIKQEIENKELKKYNQGPFFIIITDDNDKDMIFPSLEDARYHARCLIRRDSWEDVEEISG